MKNLKIFRSKNQTNKLISSRSNATKLNNAWVLFAAALTSTATALHLLVCSFLGPIGAIVAVIIVTQFMGGKEYGPGEYPDPYSFINIIPKADGTGNQIFGLEREGTVLIASENGNDDIYGTAGQDIMIGKAGKNTILGYGGNDQIEGRSNDDILVDGTGDDEILGVIGKIANDNFHQKIVKISKTKSLKYA